jgi:hypothetical protein
MSKSRQYTIVALVLLLTACAAQAASPSDVSTPSEPATSEPPVTKPTVNDFATTIPPVGFPITTPTALAAETAEIQAAFPARLAVTAQDGHILTFSPGEDPVDTDGLLGPSGDVVVSSDTIGGTSTIEWHDVATDQISASVQIKGEVRPTAVAEDGKLVALIGIVGKQTTVVLATPTKGEVRRWVFDALLVPEAFANAFDPAGDGLPIGVFALEYFDNTTYRVRVIDTATGELGLPLNLRDKSQLVDEVMTAVSRMSVFEPVNQLLFTLYQDAGGWDGAGSFIHTLGLVNGVWCLDVPAELALAENAGALAVSPDGSRLYAASGGGGVAGFLVSDLTTMAPQEPEARTTAALGASADIVAIGASNDEVVVALGGSIFRLDPDTLAVDDSFVWDMNVEALTVLDDGSVVIVGTGRMTLVSPDNKLLAERPLPINAGEITRVAVVD